MKKLLLILISVTVLVACGSSDNTTTEPEEKKDDENIEVEDSTSEVEEIYSAEEVEEMADEMLELMELTEEEMEKIEVLEKKEEVLISLIELLENGQAFDSGNYIPGDIPKGEYAFVQLDGGGGYYSEKEINGNIIDNENFDSFGYVYVHEIGNIETRGILVPVDRLEELGVTGSKELYEKLNEVEDYEGSGYYKVGVDIEPGQYVIESFGGSSYVAIESGPVGNSNIINNNNFEGRYAIEVSEGQYLTISRGLLVE